MIDWIKLSNDLPSHPKTLRLARGLKLEEAGWYVFTLWCWCSKHCQDGVISGPDPAGEVELAAGWRKKPGVFVEAAIAAGFLDRREDGSLEVHDWLEWNGEAISRAEREAKKKREKRREQARTGDGQFAERQSPGNRRATAAQPPGSRPAAVDEDVDEDVEKKATNASHSCAADAPPIVLAVQDVPSPKPKPERRPSEQEQLYAWMQAERAKAFPQAPADEAMHPAKLNPLLKPLLDDHGRKGAEAAWLAYLRSDAGRSTSPSGALRLFVTLAGKFVTEAQRNSTGKAKPNGTYVPAELSNHGNGPGGIVDDF